MMTGAFWQWREVHLTLATQSVEQRDDTARTSGTFSLSYRPSEGAAVETHHGPFALQWQKINGNWKVVSASGDYKQLEGG